MPRRVEEDYQDFMDIYAGRRRKALKKFIEDGSIFRTRGKGDKVRITIPRINIPHFVFGKEGQGIGRGPGKKGDVVGKDPDKGQGRGAGQEEGDGIDIDVDLEEVLKFLQEELKLPDLKPKPNQTYEEIKIKYNDISMQGPESLRHNRRTMLQALKRMCASGEIMNLHKIPGFADPIRLITPINSDRRYRQYREIKIPASNAVVFFARDGSGSMDQYKCDIVSDMAWWIDIWLRKFYKRVEEMYVWHDTIASEVDQNKFYRHRYGGGTTCSSALQLIAKQLENRFPPEKWNVYVFYFTDGENYDGDNAKFCDIIKKQFPPEIANFVGITQVLSYSYDGSLQHYVDENIGHLPNVRTTGIAEPDRKDPDSGGWGWYTPQLGEEERNKQIKRAIVDLLGVAENTKKKSKTGAKR